MHFSLRFKSCHSEYQIEINVSLFLEQIIIALHKGCVSSTYYYCPHKVCVPKHIVIALHKGFVPGTYYYSSAQRLCSWNILLLLCTKAVFLEHIIIALYKGCVLGININSVFKKLVSGGKYFGFQF